MAIKPRRRGKLKDGVYADTTDWNNMKKRMLSGNNLAVNVGFFKEDRYGPENNNLRVAQVAAWQEEGTTRIPPRPFMRASLMYMKSADRDFKKANVRQLRSVYNGTQTMTSYHKWLGEYTQGLMKESITEFSYPENRPSTIRGKGFNDPLVHTGKMWQSVKWKMSRKEKSSPNTSK